MESYATREATVKVLEALGFLVIEDDPRFFDSPGKDNFSLPVVQASIYQCTNMYWCVDLDGGAWGAPIVWEGPRANWDVSNPRDDFVDFLNRNYPGWKG